MKQSLLVLSILLTFTIQAQENESWLGGNFAIGAGEFGQTGTLQPNAIIISDFSFLVQPYFYREKVKNGIGGGLSFNYDRNVREQNNEVVKRTNKSYGGFIFWRWRLGKIEAAKINFYLSPVLRFTSSSFGTDELSGRRIGEATSAYSAQLSAGPVISWQFAPKFRLLLQQDVLQYGYVSLKQFEVPNRRYSHSLSLDTRLNGILLGLEYRL